MANPDGVPAGVLRAHSIGSNFMATELTDGPERLDVTLRLPQTAYRDFALLAQEAHRLADIEASISTNEKSISLEEIYSRASSVTHISRPQIETIIQTLLNLSSLTAKVRVSASQIVDLIADTAEGSATEKWRSSTLPSWKAARDQISQAIEGIQESEILLAASKAKQLTFTHQNILTDINIITELRPVFNEPGDKVLQMVLTHYLMIEYSSGGGGHRMQLAVDAADIENLKKRCERAQVKETTLKEALSNQPWHLSVPRDPNPSRG